MQKKWDDTYRKLEGKPISESCWVLRNHTHLLPAQGKCLDLACGRGANALLLAECGLESHAWDISPVALEAVEEKALSKSLKINTLQRNVEQHPPEIHSFDVIVVSQFLHRPSCADLVKALKPGGLLFYQTYHQHKLNSKGPSNEKFLLQPQELLSLFSDLEVVLYREDGRSGNLMEGLRDLSYFIGRKKAG